jgi:hypothetical protein
MGLDDQPALAAATRRKCFEAECDLARLREQLRPISKEEVTRLANANPEVWGEYEGMGS